MTSHERPKILIVDDRQENILALEAALEEMDCDLFKATSGQEALRLAVRHQFDLALLDVQMPEMDGFELARLLRGKKEHQKLQIIFITALSKERKYIEKGYEVGAINYLFKPIDPDELRNKVKVVLNWQKYDKALRAAETKRPRDSASSE